MSSAAPAPVFAVSRVAWGRGCVSRSPSPSSTRSGGSSVRTRSPSLLSDFSASSPRPYALPFAANGKQGAVLCCSPRASPTRSPAPAPTVASLASMARARATMSAPKETGLPKASEPVRPRANSYGSLPECNFDCRAGDVLFVRGTGGIADIGTTGGFLGHFLVVTAAPARLSAPELRQVQGMNGELEAARLWKVETVESTRSHRGLHKSHMVLHLEPTMGCITVVAEFLPRRRELELVEVEPEPVQLWQSPPELRGQITDAAVREVLQQMKAAEQNWSLATAARAVLLQASVRGREAEGSLLKELRACWQEAPICTSIVVIFWQRLIGMLAPALGASHAVLILRYLPLKADRGLPGELLSTLGSCGWIMRQHVTCTL